MLRPVTVACLLLLPLLAACSWPDAEPAIAEPATAESAIAESAVTKLPLTETAAVAAAPAETGWSAAAVTSDTGEVARPQAELSGHFTQGGLVFGQVEPGTRVLHDGASLAVSADGRFLIGFDRDAGRHSELAFEYPDGSRETMALDIAPREYDIQRIDGLPPQQVTPPPEALARIAQEAALLQEARARIRESREPYLDEEFLWPVTGRITGVFGSQRILNGVPGSVHVGLDIANATGTPIRAPASGIVAFTHPDMYFNGGTVLLDHGHGLSSIYIHMHRIHVQAGQHVQQGDVIGEVGATGRATGPHLHWGVNWNDARIDPQLLVGPMPAN